MRILQVIHGYPMRYNAGSEVYTQTLCHGLASRHNVHVFTREENSFAPDFTMRQETDPDLDRITLHLVNIPRSKDRYRHIEVDQRFSEVLESFKPEIVHIGHLNHLSTSLILAAAEREIPIVYTLHDYWLMCPRGQFMQMFPENSVDLWAACDGQEDRKCAQRCYQRYFSGAPDEWENDIAYWTDWVKRRMTHVRQMVELVDLFIAPARYLLERYRDHFGIPEGKLVYLDYGFDRNRMQGRQRKEGEPFTFGYIGTHIPAKGIHQLIAAFGKLKGETSLRIWGRHRGQDSEALKALAAALPSDKRDCIEWMSEYRNQDINADVFNLVDAIVVPSVWVENSPLVIHEAQEARVPVVTADAGGMAEYVHHEVNGLLFKHRDIDGLAEQMQHFVDDPAFARRLGERGYLYSNDGHIPDVDTQVRDMESIYQRLLDRRDSSSVKPLPGPWRITFDTNPDTCNLHCIMCEEHSEWSPKQQTRRAESPPPRLMPIELIRKIIPLAAKDGLKEVIPSTMGEPLLYEHFDEIVELCRESGVMLNLTTNGTFPRRSAEEWAGQLVPITEDVKFSINGASRETQEHIMRGSNFERMISNIKNFIAIRDLHVAEGGHRCRVSFQLTFMECNIRELPDMVRLAISLGVDRVKGHHLWAHFDELKALSLRRDTDAITRWNSAVDELYRIIDAHRLPDGQRILLENINRLDLNSVNDLAPGGPCPFLGQEAWISSEGRFDPCCAPDDLRRRLGDFGNLHETSLSDIWHGDAYRHLVRTYRNRHLCLGCNMRRPE